MFPAKLIGTGRAVPRQKVTSSDLAAQYGLCAQTLGCDHAMISRYFCTDEDQIDLAIAASRNALEAAGKTINDIDMIIAACGVPYQSIPGTAPLIMKRLGIADGAAMAFDVNSTCLSFVTGLEVAARMMDRHSSGCALVVSSERASRALPWQNDPQTALLFGDGAGAAIVSGPTGDGAGGLIASHMQTFPSAYSASQLGSGGTRIDYHAQKTAFEQHARFEMNGRELFRVTARHFVPFLDALLSKARWSRDCVDLVVPHQASPKALEHMIAISGFSDAQVMNIAAHYGNQIAASIPFALDLAVAQGKASKGDKLLLIGTSAGVSIGGIALEL